MPHRANSCTSCGREMFEGARYCTYCGTDRPGAFTPPVQEEIDHVFEVKKIGIWSLIKFFFMAHAFFGLLLGIVFASFGMAGLGMVDLPIPIQGSPLLGKGLLVGMLLIFPILYGVIGAIFGVIAGILYNISAWGVGGIRIKLKKQ